MTSPLRKPFAHQRQTVQFLRDRPRALDWSDCGTGKTGSEIFAHDQYGSKCALVLAPKSILEPAWAEDVRSFSNLVPSVAYADNRAEAFAANADIYITNHDAVKWLADQTPKFFDRFSTLIVDEATAYKHPTSARSKALSKIKKHFPVRRGMTATPNSNTITDVWNQAFVIDDGRRLGKSFYAFRNATCAPTLRDPKEPRSIIWTDRDGAEVAVMGLLGDITIRHKLEECTDIPPNHQYERHYPLKPRHLALYKKLEKAKIVEVDLKTITAINGAVLAQKLLQIASGAVYDDTGGYTMVDTGRYELTMDLVEEARQSVVFFQWVHQKDEMLKEAAKRNLSIAVLDGSVSDIRKRNEIVANFQKGFYRAILIHPQTGAHGLTLTSAVRTIWPSPTYNQELFHQGIKRIHRAGQREVTETIVIVAPGTYDEQAYKSCGTKGVRMYGLLELAEAA